MFLFKKAESLGLIRPIHVGVHDVPIKHLQFADDTLLFIPLDEEIIWNYLRTLDVFSIMSGLTLNYEKTSIVRWNNKGLDTTSKLSVKLGCRLQ